MDIDSRVFGFLLSSTPEIPEPPRTRISQQFQQFPAGLPPFFPPEHQDGFVRFPVQFVQENSHQSVANARAAIETVNSDGSHDADHAGSVDSPRKSFKNFRKIRSEIFRRKRFSCDESDGFFLRDRFVDKTVGIGKILDPDIGISQSLLRDRKECGDPFLCDGAELDQFERFR